jgi:hypothetical protein
MAPVPHYVILSPLESPIAYAFFVVNWLSSLICIFVSVHFFRKQRGTWWLLVALAFTLPLLYFTIFCLLHGLPPLPYGVESHFSQQHLPSALTSGYADGATASHLTGSIVVTRGVTSNSIFDPLPPLLAIALLWAYVADRKKRADGGI